MNQPHQYGEAQDEATVTGFEVPRSPETSYNNVLPGNEDDESEPPMVPRTHFRAADMEILRSSTRRKRIDNAKMENEGNLGVTFRKRPPVNSVVRPPVNPVVRPLVNPVVRPPVNSVVVYTSVVVYYLLPQGNPPPRSDSSA
ncbi:SNF1-related protein kinase regulatory subunit beta-3 [Capsicum baccatum]|uniref:SNF1-related protein kinase regulatory subunit beta-3 n=1 Tax=Capsicum baccatum TaxID=33114 RepID=A0A2G2VQT4_CAPBA|nr:SNF1-related protein kinase regulatory subunit beta-3 [Capsicum baccatum]